MDKSKKKKVAGAAVAAGAAAVGSAFINNEEHRVEVTEPVEPQDILADGGELPEVVITGNAPIADGGELPGVTITGTSTVTAELQTAEITEEAVAEIKDDEIPAVEEYEEFEPAAENILTETVIEEEFHDEFDETEELMAQTGSKESDGNIIKEFIDKAEGFLGVGDNTETEMPDFDNAANVNEFTGM